MGAMHTEAPGTAVTPGNISAEDPLTVAERSREMLSATTAANHKSAVGQFLTSAATAREMAAMVDAVPARVASLDPGAGAGALTAALVSELCRCEVAPHQIATTAVETDPALLPYLEQTLEQCKLFAANYGVTFTYSIQDSDFLTQFEIEENADLLDGSFSPRYDIAVLNPPYMKIRTDSSERRALSIRGIEVSNMYAAFVWKTLQLLSDRGQAIAITPRSFCNGSYFRKYRQYLLSNGSLDQVHVYRSRRDAFKDDDVLQENIIFKVTKAAPQRPNIQVVEAHRPGGGPICEQRVDYTHMVLASDSDKYIHLPVTETDRQVVETMAALPYGVDDLGLCVSTGPVVEFRAKHQLASAGEPSTVPLIYPRHFKSGRVRWPNGSRKNDGAILVDDYSRRHLIPIGDYALVKRFSSKEEKRRVVAAGLYATDFLVDQIGLENHVNFIWSRTRSLDPAEVAGIVCYLNSTFVDQYFRRFSGHTQVNAADLRKLRWPSSECLAKLGNTARGEELRQEELDQLIERHLQIHL